MKVIRTSLIPAFFLLICIVNTAFFYVADNSPLTGAWKLQHGNDEHVAVFIDGYCTITGFSKKDKKFTFTRGGTYVAEKDKLSLQYEFDTGQKDQVGTTASFSFVVSNNQLTSDISGKSEVWTRIDDGTKNLAGLWKITGRKQADTIAQIHQTGPRKTVKILSGTRFQWAAINPETKEFFGTGGGNYTFVNGKYTENIEFFSRDSSRVGASLSFNGKLENGAWHHSGSSSKGEPIYEVWSKVK